jgi:ribosomal protein L11 methyltransferase
VQGRERCWLEAELALPVESALAPEDQAGIALLALLPLGCLGVEECDPGLRAYFPADTEPSAIVAALEESAAGVHLRSSAEVADPGWVEAFHGSLQPLDVGRRFTILPGADGEPGPGRLALRFEPGRAFGTGHHESTRLALQWLEETLEPGARVLDVGTGTGILAAAAARLGAAEVLGTDNDPEAIEVAEATLQALPERDVVRLIVSEGPGDAGVGWDLVLANITADVLGPLLPGLAARMSEGASLVLAGLLVSDRPAMEDRLAAEGLRASWREEGEWASCCARRA